VQIQNIKTIFFLNKKILKYLAVYRGADVAQVVPHHISQGNNKKRLFPL